MYKTKSLYALAMAIALPVTFEVAGTAAAAELSPPLPPAAPAVSPLEACFPLLIESGSDQDYVDADGQTWQADVGFLGGSAADRGNLEIADTTNDRLYQTERYGSTGYIIKVPNGAYKVSLHFAETFHDAAGKRVFSVAVEDRAIKDLDVFAEAGGKDKALVKTLDNVVVTDGELNVDFTGKGAIINGIAVAAVPPVLALNGAAVAEDAAAGTVIGTVTATSAGDSAVHYELSDSAGGRFAIDAETGELTVAADASLDFEAQTSHNIVVSATDDRDARAEAAFTITVLDVIEPATGLLQFAHLLPENAAAGAGVGVISAADPAAASGVTFALSNDAAGRFTIDPASGKVRVAENAELDFETASSHEITAVASDGAERSFKVALEDVNEPISALSLSAQSVEASAPAGTVVGVASAIDPDRAETITYALVNDADGRFEIDPATGAVGVASNAAGALEADARHRIVIQATDSAGHALSEGFTIAVVAPVEMPEPVFIEAGGENEHIDARGRHWLSDTGFIDGQIADRGAMEIAGTDNDRIYQTERWGVSAYSLPLATGVYTVKLHFAETSERVTEAGTRVFSVDVEGHAVKDIDAFAEAGSKTALVKTVPNVFVTDGHLDIAFERKAGEPIINGIELEPVLTCTAPAL